MEKHSDKSLLARQTGGDGYRLPANTAFVAEQGQRAMNIDWLGVDPVTFSVLEALDADGNSVSVLGDTPGMNIDGYAVPTMVRNFTKWGGFTKITTDQDIWLNLENTL